MDTASVINVHFISDSGEMTSVRYEADFETHQILSKSAFFPEEEVRFCESSEVHFGHQKLFTAEVGGVKVYRVENGEGTSKLNIPVMSRCENCETVFPTKYQYQRHQCEFNAEKVALKPDSDLEGKKVKFDCPTCGKQFVSNNYLARHLTTHDASKVHTCEHCNKQFVTEGRLRIHEENHCSISKVNKSDATVWKCKKCQEVFSSSVNAGYHVEVCAELIGIKKEPTDELTEEISAKILLQCEFCNRTYADKLILLKHQKTHTTDKNYECVICMNTFDSYVTASQHWLKKCSERANLFYLPKLTYCEFCGHTFKSHETLYIHKIKKQHYTPKIHDSEVANPPQVHNINNEDVIDDDLIEKALIALEISINNQLKNENKENEVEVKIEPLLDEEVPRKKKRGRKPKCPKGQPVAKPPCSVLEEGYKYQCEKCVEVWGSVGELEAHRKKEHVGNFNCDECGKVLHSARGFVLHTRAHSGLKPYLCDTCGKRYAQTSHLWQHMRFHQGIKPFACPYEGCDARYTVRPDLRDHIRKAHTRERPFKCSTCGKSFLTGSVYYQHRLIHKQDKRYGCEICQKRFVRADTLNNHRRIHANEKPYSCFVCGRRFRQKGDVNKHCRTQHPETIMGEGQGVF